MSARLIAFYLPQFHPIPENDRWWGKGFTEWTNVAKAKPLFRGHYQPHLPADLGFYDLRVPETREAQATLARQYGIEAFCYWHYWFGNGVRVLDRPFHEVLTSGTPAFPFCLGWANESWTGIWHGARDRVLLEQRYPGWEDYRRHFAFLLTAFSDRRYLRVDGRPLLYIYRPTEIPGCARVTDFWRELAGEAGLPGLYLVAQSPGRDWNPHDHGFDAGSVSNHDKIRQMRIRSPIGRLKRKLCRSRIVGDGLCRYIRKPIHTYRYAEAVGHFLEPGVPWEYHPMVVPNWDNTPRAGRRGVVLHGSTPELFRANVRAALQLTSGRTPERRLLFIKSWNEWAEGNHLEPDQRYGLRYLQVLREEKETLAREEGNRP